ncbi:MAG: polysaccharide biosynthesis C-terminal domain-containing protein [Nitrospirota bacterium]|nr:polysaccharide biosynthesis C-terminal domain-containing protein [Nitrospirota bacterium]
MGLGILVSISVVPLVVSLVGPKAWAGIAVAQSVAGFGAIVVVFGWGITGPSKVASIGRIDRGQFFADSLASRIWLFLFVTPVILVVVWCLSLGDVVANAFSALAIVIPSLGASWFFIGEGSSRRLLVFESIPKAAGSVVGVVALFVSGNLVFFTGAQVVGAILAVVLGSRSVLSRHANFKLSAGLRNSLHRLGSQTGGMVTTVTSSLYVSFPLVAVSWLSPTSVEAYALADKLLKLFLTGLSPVVQVAVGYVPATDPVEHRRRSARAFRVALFLGLIVGAAFALIGPLIGDVLTAHKVQQIHSLFLPLAAALFSVTVSGTVGVACLTSFGHIGRVATSTVMGALIGVPLVVLAALSVGAVGVSWAVACSELVVAGYQVFYLRRVVRAQATEIVLDEEYI